MLFIRNLVFMFLIAVPLLGPMKSNADGGGGSDGGGGLHKTTPEDVEAAVKLVDLLLLDNGVANDLLMRIRKPDTDFVEKNFHGLIVPVPAVLPADQVMDLYDGRFDRGGYGTKRESIFYTQNEMCRGKTGKLRQASVEDFRPNARICFSLSGIAKKTTPDQLFVEVLALAYHELVHAYGGEQMEADLLQKHIVRNFPLLSSGPMRIRYIGRDRTINHIIIEDYFTLFKLVNDIRQMKRQKDYYISAMEKGRTTELPYVLGDLLSRAQWIANTLKKVQAGSAMTLLDLSKAITEKEALRVEDSTTGFPIKINTHFLSSQNQTELAMTTDKIVDYSDRALYNLQDVEFLNKTNDPEFAGAASRVEKSVELVDLLFRDYQKLLNQIFENSVKKSKDSEASVNKNKYLDSGLLVAGGGGGCCGKR